MSNCPLRSRTIGDRGVTVTLGGSTAQTVYNNFCISHDCVECTVNDECCVCGNNGCGQECSI